MKNLKTKLYHESEPIKSYTTLQNIYAPQTKQLKIKGVKYPNR